MIGIRFCQKFPIKAFRVSSLSFPVSEPSIDHHSPSAPNGLWTSTFLLARRYSAPAQCLNSEDSNLFCQEKSHTFNSISFPHSITPFRFEDVPSDHTQGNTTQVQILGEWKQLLESLKTIIDDFHCADIAVYDVSAVRQMLERHHLVKFLVKPYSYTADDVLSLTPSELTCRVWDVHSFPGKGETTAVEPVLDYTENNPNSYVQHSSYITLLEEESLKAVVVLSNGSWKPRTDVHAESAWTSLLSPRISHAMLCEMKSTEAEQKKSKNSKGSGRPNRDQLTAVQNYMADNLPKIFVKFHSYDIYTNDVIFENNWYFDRSYATVGTTAYALEIAKLRLFVHLQYANVKMQLLKITTNAEEGTVQVRWRISGIPQVKAIMFWKYLPWANKSSASFESEWLDGFSTFYVEDTGLIFKHRMDRVIPDEGIDLKKNQSVIEKIASKIATPANPVTA